MKKIKQFWKNLKYWQKGGIIGLVIGLLLSTELGAEIIGGVFWILSYTLVCGLIYLTSENLFGKCANIILKLDVMFLPLLFGIIGTLIGFIIEKLKKR